MPHGGPARKQQRGFVVWFTGLSGSGKSTLATLLADELRGESLHVELLDGDEIRKHLSKDLGFSREDREENVRRIAYVAMLLARSGACAVVAAISPYESGRREARKSCEQFVEVYTECPLPVLVERDPKGLYRRALQGELRAFTGVDDPYEAPAAPDVHLRTDTQSPDACVRVIVQKLQQLGLVGRAEV